MLHHADRTHVAILRHTCRNQAPRNDATHLEPVSRLHLDGLTQQGSMRKPAQSIRPEGAVTQPYGDLTALVSPHPRSLKRGNQPAWNDAPRHKFRRDGGLPQISIAFCCDLRDFHILGRCCKSEAWWDAAWRGLLRNLRYIRLRFVCIIEFLSRVDFKWASKCGGGRILFLTVVAGCGTVWYAVGPVGDLLAACGQTEVVSHVLW